MKRWSCLVVTPSSQKANEIGGQQQAALMLMDSDGSATPKQALETLKETSLKVQKDVLASDSKNVATMIECKRNKAKQVMHKIETLQHKLNQIRRNDNAQVKKVERSVKNEFQTLYKALQEDTTPLATIRTGRRGAGQSIQKRVGGRGGAGVKKTGRAN